MCSSGVATCSIGLQREAVRFELDAAVQGDDADFASLDTVQVARGGFVEDVHVIIGVSAGYKPSCQNPGFWRFRLLEA